MFVYAGCAYAQAKSGSSSSQNERSTRMMSSTSEQYDAKKFPLCAPWDGQRGPSWQETFLPDVKFAWGQRGDDFRKQAA